MNVLDVLKYGDLTLTGAIDGLPTEHWRVGGVCGVWSIHDIVAHLTSYEQLLHDVLVTFTGGGATPTFDTMGRLGPAAFNDEEVARRSKMHATEVMAEYQQVHGQIMQRAAQIPTEVWRENGTLPWYGAEYCLDDLVVYNNYAHKREHVAEINVYKTKHGLS